MDQEEVLREKRLFKMFQLDDESKVQELFPGIFDPNYRDNLSEDISNLCRKYEFYNYVKSIIKFNKIKLN